MSPWVRVGRRRPMMRPAMGMAPMRRRRFPVFGLFVVLGAIVIIGFIVLRRMG